MDDAQDQDELLLQPLSPVTKPRPRALWAALAAVVLAAGALAVTHLGADDGSAPPIPISLLSGGGGRAEVAADSSLAWVRYEAGPDLPALGGTGPVYRLGAVTEAQVRHLADALGVKGDPRHDAGQWTIPDGARLLNVSEAGGAWWFNGATVAVDQGAASSGVAEACGPGADCAVAGCAAGVDCQPATATAKDPCGAAPVAPNVDCVGAPSVPPDSAPSSTGGTTSSPPVTPIPEPLPPDSAPCAKVVSTECGTAPDPELPSKPEARALALDLLERAGTTTSGAVVTVDGGVGIWVVSVEPMLEGRPSGLVAQALVGPKGEIQGANGFLTQPERVGTYPVLTTSATMDRANQTMARGRTVNATTGDDVAVVGGTTTVTGCRPQPSGIDICEPIAPDDPSTAVTGEPGVSGVAPPPTVPETTVPIEPASVILVDAVPVLMMIGATDGSADVYLVPGYRFTPDGGGQVDLVALSDDAIAGPPTTDTTPTADTTPPSSDGRVDPPATTPRDCEPLVEGDDTGTTHTIPLCAPTTSTVAVDPVDPGAPVTTAAVIPETATTLVAEP